MQLTTLRNGLRIVSRSMRSVETVAIGLHADVGSRHDPAELSGLAHLFEHMVFKGAGGRSAREISEAIENVGGELNAWTDREATAFHASLLAPDLPLGLGLIADLVLRPHFESEHLATEKKVVHQELAEARDTASDIIFDYLHQAAFPGQPIGRSVLGDERSIDRVRPADLKDWLSNHYRPDRLILAAAGKLDHDQLVELADRSFGAMTPGPVLPAGPASFTGGHRFDRRRCRQAQIAIGLRAPSWSGPESFAAQLFADVVGAGSSSRLFQELREQQGLAYSVSASTQTFRDSGLFWIYLATDREQVLFAQEEVERVLRETLDTLSQAEVDRARALAKASMMMSLESCWGQASYLATRLQREGRLVEPEELLARLNSVTLEEVRDAGLWMLGGPRALASVGGSLAKAA